MPILLNSVHFIGKYSYQLVKLAFILSALGIGHLIGNYPFAHIFSYENHMEFHTVMLFYFKHNMSYFSNSSFI